VESAKEAKNIMDDKVQRITESFAEIRSIVYQREATAKEQEVAIDKIKETVSQVDTARILREFTTRDEQMRDVNTRLERLERSGKMLSETMNKIKGLMTDIGSLENVIKASKLVGEKLEKIQEIEERIKSISSRLDGVYIDMKKRLDEFGVYKIKQDKLSGMAEDLVKNVEDLTRRLSDYATKSDMYAFGDELKRVKYEIKKVTAPELPPEVRGLQEEKAQIEDLLATLEENLKNKEISKEEYESAKEGNVKRLQQIEEKIRSYSKSAPAKAKVAEAPAATADGKKHERVMMLAKLRESYEKGEISKQAYDRSKKLLLKK
jgi:chromosome segregation ATPase